MKKKYDLFTKREKIEHFILFASMLSIFAIMSLFLFWWLWPYKTADQVSPYKVLTKEVKQGELLMYEIEYCKYTDVIPTVQRQFIDGIVYTIPQGNVQIRKGCGKVINSIVVPAQLPPGEYYLSVRASFRMNPLRTIDKTTISEKFTVIKSNI